MNRKLLGRIVSDAVTVPLWLGHKLVQPVFIAANAVAQRLPTEKFHQVGDEETQAETKIVYDFFSGIGPELAHPGGSLPGSNEWDRKPSAERPIPVILVHGTAGGGQTNWGTYVPLLADEGFSVFTLTYGQVPNANWPISALGGMLPIEDSAAEFGRFVDKVLDATGAEKVDIVGHSQGTIMPGYWAKFLGGAPKIRKYISLAPLWEGSAALDRPRGPLLAVQHRFGLSPATVMPCRALPQMIHGSEFIKKMNEGGTPYVEGIEYTNISTIHDELVRPYTSGQVPAPEGSDIVVHNIVLQEGCDRDLSDHLGICGSPRAAAYVLNALDDRGQHVVPCRLVAPFFGSAFLRPVKGVPELITPFSANHDE